MDCGARVTIIALSPELNGTPCTVVSFDAAAGLYDVLLEPAHGKPLEPRMRLRPANLTPHASPLDEARVAVALRLCGDGARAAHCRRPPLLLLRRLARAFAPHFGLAGCQVCS